MARVPQRLLLFVAIAALALALRLWHLGLATFGSDEAVLLFYAEDMLRKGVFQLSGPLSSVGLSTPAHYIYAILPAVAISRDPLVAVVYMALIGTVGVVLVMVLGTRAFGLRVGAIGGLLFAVSPLMVAYSRRIWQPDLIPTLAALTLLALYLGVVERKAWWAAVAAPLATFSALVHSAIAPVAPLLAAPMFILLRARKWPLLLGSLISAALICVPFLLYEIETKWADYPNFRYYSSLHTFVDLDAVRWFVGVATGWRLPNDGVVPPPQRVIPAPVLDAAAAAALLLLVAGIAVALYRLVRPCAKLRIPLAGILLWIALPIAFSIRHWQPLYLHYFFGALPAAFLVMALATALGTRITNLVALVLAVAVIGVQFGATAGGMAYAASSPNDPCYLPTIDSTRNVASQIIQFARDGNASLAFVELNDSNARPMGYLLRGDFPDVYLPHPTIPSQTPRLIGNVGLGRAVEPLRASSPPGPPLFTAPEVRDIHYANGISLDATAVSRRSETDQHVTLLLRWSVDQSAQANAAANWQVTLEDAQGHALQGDSAWAVVPSEMRGRTAVSWFSIDPRREIAPEARPAGTYQFGVELFEQSAQPHVLTFTDRGGAVAERLRIPVEIDQFVPCDLESTIP